MRRPFSSPRFDRAMDSAVASTSSNFGVLVALLFAAIPLVALAKRVNVSYPIVLVVSGLILGFIPGLPHVGMDPDLVLLTFLPPLLYWGAITAPTEAMRANAGRIAFLAFGLVVVTTLVAASIAHAMVPGLPWAVAIVAGAIISPTDELASVPVLERFRLPRQLVATVGGESLLNDASALVIYGAGMAVITTGTFDPATTVVQFLLTLFGSTFVGYVAARIAVEIWKRVKDKLAAMRRLRYVALSRLSSGRALQSVRGARGGHRGNVCQSLHAAPHDARIEDAGHRFLDYARVHSERRVVHVRRLATARRRARRTRYSDSSFPAVRLFRIAISSFSSRSALSS